MATMLENLGFQKLVEETLTVKRQTRAVPMYGFIMGMVLACYLAFSHLNLPRFFEREPMLTGILRVAQLPPRSAFWRFLASLHLGVGKKSYQRILSFIAETREYAAGALRTRDRPSGQEIAAHLESVAKGLPAGVKIVCVRADSGFYCWAAVEICEKRKWRYIGVARKTAPPIDELQAANWNSSPRSDADEQCEFIYQPQGYGPALLLFTPTWERMRQTPCRIRHELSSTPSPTFPAHWQRFAPGGCSSWWTTRTARTRAT